MCYHHTYSQNDPIKTEIKTSAQEYWKDLSYIVGNTSAECLEVFNNFLN